MLPISQGSFPKKNLAENEIDTFSTTTLPPLTFSQLLEIMIQIRRPPPLTLILQGPKILQSLTLEPFLAVFCYDSLKLIFSKKASQQFLAKNINKFHNFMSKFPKILECLGLMPFSFSSLLFLVSFPYSFNIEVTLAIMHINCNCC